MKTTPDQLSLPLFDTTALTSSMVLYSGLTFGKPVDDPIAETEDDAPPPVVVRDCLEIGGAGAEAVVWRLISDRG